MSAERFLVVEHRPHARAAVSYCIIDTLAIDGEKHTATVTDAHVAEAITGCLNAAPDYSGRLMAARNGDPF